MPRQTLKKLDVLSVCRTVFVIDFLLVLFLGGVITFLLLLMPATHPTPSMKFMPLMLVFVHPLLVTGMTGLACVIFNFIIRTTGGIKVWVE